tara:strand:+ start:188 stop:397 length:210 start_codon:yes stop_codon:yes gene_type:complete
MSGEIEEMLTLEQAAKVLGGVCTTTIRRYIAKGRKTKGEDGIWPVYRLPGKVLIPPSSLERYLERNRAV